MRVVVTQKMARTLAECCCYHEERVRSLERYLVNYDPPSANVKVIKKDIGQSRKFAGAIQELMGRRMSLGRRTGR